MSGLTNDRNLNKTATDAPQTPKKNRPKGEIN